MFELFEVATEEGLDRIPVPPTTAIPEEAARALLARLPPLAEEITTPFTLRKGSLQPPTAEVRVLRELFPKPVPTEAAPNPPPGELTVLRFQPEGDVPVARNLSVTFSLPMVPISGNAELAQRERPVTLTPEPKGSWRWLGTRTLLFAPERRFPMATEYRVDVQSGARAMDGSPLETGRSFSFSTPPASLRRTHPRGEAVGLSPILFASFDQLVDPASVLETIAVSAEGLRQAVVLATPEELATDSVALALSHTEPVGRWVAFRLERELPKGTWVTVTVGPGTPSAEGSRRSTRPESFEFRTYNQLAVEEQSCECLLAFRWVARFNNPLDGDAFQDEWIRTEPALTDMRTGVEGNTIFVSGRAKPRSEVEVVLSRDLVDSFGQRLEEDVVFRMRVAGNRELRTHGRGMVLDPKRPPEFTFLSTNYSEVEIQIWRVSPRDYPDWEPFETRRRDEFLERVGRKVHDSVLDIGGVDDVETVTRVDLSPFLDHGVGQLVVLVRPPGPDHDIAEWVQVTQLGLSAVRDREGVSCWVNRLSDGAPISGAELSLVPNGPAARSDEQGLATIIAPLKAGDSVLDEERPLLVAKLGEDVAFIHDLSTSYEWTHPQVLLRIHAFSDRGIYRPGETVHVKGWLRLLEDRPHGDLGLAPEVRHLDWSLTDARDALVAKGRAPLSGLGGFDLSVALPTTANLGHASLELRAEGARGYEEPTRVELALTEFRRPELEITASASAAAVVAGEPAEATVRARYYTGEGLPNAEVRWWATEKSAWYSPPGWDEYSFGYHAWRWGPDASYRGRRDSTRELVGQTNSLGRHSVRLEVLGKSLRDPRRIALWPSVHDVNRQVYAAGTSILVHPSRLAVGIRTKRIRAGGLLSVDTIVTDLDGRAVPGAAVEVRGWRTGRRARRGREEEKLEERACSIVSGRESVRCELGATRIGEYRVRARVADQKGREHESELALYVPGPRLGAASATRTPMADELAEPVWEYGEPIVQLIPDKPSYRPGDTAEVLIRGSFAPAEGLLTLERSGIVRTERFSMSGATHLLHVKIEEEHIPNLAVAVSLVGSARIPDSSGQHSGEYEPVYAKGRLELQVSKESRTLTVVVTPEKTVLEPGERTKVRVEVADFRGAPVPGAEVTVLVVDESVLDLGRYRIKSPLEVFYRARDPGTVDAHSRAYLRSVPWECEDGDSRCSAAGSGEGELGPGDQISARSDFNPVALFSPTSVTNASGRVTLDVQLPGNLTRYRITAIAVSGPKRFGAGVSTLTARKSLMIRPSLPRFLSYGDSAELPVVVQNRTDAPISVAVAARVSNLSLRGHSGTRVEVPANDRAEVRFPVETKAPGTARIQVAASAGLRTDGVELSIPVWTPATTEVFATYGELSADGAIRYPIDLGPNLVTSYGSLELSTASTLTQPLQDAVAKIVGARGSDTVSLASRVIAITSVWDLLGTFAAKALPPQSELSELVKADLFQLAASQNEDGGFRFWARDTRSWAFATVHATHALACARARGFEQSPQTLDRAHRYLAEIEERFGAESPEARRVLSAYALSVRELLGDRNMGARARQLIARAGGIEELSLETLGWVYPVLIDGSSPNELEQLRATLGNKITETAGEAHFVSSYEDDDRGLLLSSDRRTDALILSGLIRDRATSTDASSALQSAELVPKLVRGLLSARNGSWASPQDDLWEVLALSHYAREYESTAPSFTARAWLGSLLATEQQFRGRGREVHQLAAPMDWLTARTPFDLTLSKKGPGRLHYRLGLEYAPKSLDLTAVDHGFCVDRAYLAVDRPRDVRRDPDGTWRVQAGARVRVKVTLLAETHRYHVALTDPLPAGFEISDPPLASTPFAPTETESYAWWYDHEGFRDDRAEVFASRLSAGVYEYTYFTRATTLGRFVVAPAKAEETYRPETFGRSATDRVVVTLTQ